MKDTILIKGNKYGLTIILDDQVDFEAIKEALFKKLNDSRKFFGASKVTIEFEGRDLSDSEKDDLIRIIQNASDLEIICVVDHTLQYEQPPQIEPIPQTPVQVVEEAPPVVKVERDYFSKKPVNDSEKSSYDYAAIFHKGTLRSGQEIISDKSIIVMGNVHNGATIVSKGNVIVIGKLSGCVHAGQGGNTAAFVVALNMTPLQLRIADVFGRASDKKGKKVIQQPQIAFIEDDRIIIENINRNIYDHINMIN